MNSTLTIEATRCLGRERRYLPPATETEFSTPAIDWYAIERVINNDRPIPPLNDDELREAALWMVRNGTPRAHVARHLGIYDQRVRDWEAAAGLLDPNDLCSNQGCTRVRSGRGLCGSCLGTLRAQERKQAKADADATGVDA